MGNYWLSNAVAENEVNGKKNYIWFLVEENIICVGNHQEEAKKYEL